MANPFSFSKAVFFEKETATPINQEARILDFVNRLVARAHARTFHVRVPRACATYVFYGANSKFLVHIHIYNYTYRESQMT